ncbi:50S ribosomal protein L5 [Patescibacteria group bacterium]|nr:50S ribosomal protein L5 [Patescibacteria group bacterium]MBU4082832.1 50S ribosomal protein L5 [Patescibacteria group bacterium]
MSGLKEKYQKKALPALKEKFGYKNDLAAPRIKKVVINTGFNPDKKDDKAQEEIVNNLASIVGQKPSFRQAKKAVATFKTRKGMIVGIAVTLRGRRMYDFLDRLVDIVLPRSRDFRGLLLKNIDQGGNLNIGIKEQIIFPEISAESAKSIFGLEIAVVTSSKNREEGIELFKLLDFPIIGLIRQE